MMGIVASLGVAPWHVLHIGLTRHLPITVGRASQIVGCVVLLAAVILGVRPRLGTWANMFMVGYFLDLVASLGLVPKVSSLSGRVALLVLGLLVQSLGIASYICADLGAGPRDSLMLGITQKTKWRVGTVRSLLECSVVTIGFLLGGPVGVGTVVNALLNGPLVERYLLMLSWLTRLPFLCDVIRLPGSIRIGNMVTQPDIAHSRAAGGR